jgi:adenine-specific DNA-methyltransferase
MNTANRLYYGDNSIVMKELLHDNTVKGKIRLIYIDPPYATNSVFQTRKQQDAYTDLITGDDYMSFMRERLVLMKELLANDGSDG